MSSEHLKLVPTPAGVHDPLLGQVLDGRYAIEKLLGEGGMGLVYKARHVTLGKPLAIKVLKADVSKDQEIVQRFRQEAQSATAIGNHHIIDISDFGALPDGSTFFVMEYLDGISLTKAIEPGRPLKSARSIHIAKQLCRALGAAHDAGIVHRDLKPDNIYLIARGGDRDFVKVLDFGIAKVGGGNSKLTQVGQVFGTPHYMSPEQCAGTVVDRRTDIYALGVIMYEMASSRVPFDADNLMGILTKHLYEEPVLPHTLPPPVDVPPALEAVIMKALAKKPELRYQTMQELLADLELVEQGLTPSAVLEGVRRASKMGGRDAGRGSGGAGIKVDVGGFELPQTKRTGLVIAALGLVVALAVGAFLVLRGAEPAQVQPEPLQAAAPPERATASATPSGAVARPATPAAPAPSTPEDAPRAAPAKTHTTTTTRNVTIDSTPAGAEVYTGGALVGHTPHGVDRPEPGQPARTVVLKLPGFKDALLKISDRSDDSLTVTLSRKTAVLTPTPAPRAPAVQPAPAPAPPPAPPAEETKRPRPRPSTEVLDPWN